MKKALTFMLNGKVCSAEVYPWQTLLEVLRESLHVTGAKEGCGEGECGACTVLMNGQPVNSCLVLALEAEGMAVVTVEGLADAGRLDALQEAFIEHGAVQCGFCTPGMIMSSKALLNSNSNPSEEEVKKAISGNLCRCTGYKQIIDAILAAAKKSDNG